MSGLPRSASRPTAGFGVRAERRAARKSATPSVGQSASSTGATCGPLHPAVRSRGTPSKRLPHKHLRKRRFKKGFAAPAGTFRNHHVLESQRDVPYTSRQSRFVSRAWSHYLSAPTLSGFFVDSSALRLPRLYPQHSARFSPPHVFSGWKTAIAGAQAQPPGLRSNPTFSLANSPVSPRMFSSMPLSPRLWEPHLESRIAIWSTQSRMLLDHF